MLPYYIFFSFFGLATSLDYVNQYDYYLQLIRKLSFCAGFILIAFFVGFRYKLGSDWVNYIVDYQNSKSLSDLFQGDNLAFSTDLTEPGYKILMSLFKEFGVNFYGFVFFITCFNTSSLFNFLNKNEIKNKFVFLAIILILTTFIEFDILRQSIAFHIMLFAFGNKETKFLVYFSLMALSMTFHYTAIIFSVFYFYEKIKLNKNMIAGMTVIYAITLFITIPILTTSLKFIAPVVGGTISSILEKAVGLIEGFNFHRTLSFTSLLNIVFLMLLANKRDYSGLSVIESILVKMFVFYIAINICFKEIQEVADRFSYYFNFGIAYMFCLLPGLIKFREKRILILTVPIIFIYMRLFLHFKDQAIWYGQTPYRNYLFSNDRDDRVIMSRYKMMMNIRGSENDQKNTK